MLKETGENAASTGVKIQRLPYYYLLTTSELSELSLKLGRIARRPESLRSWQQMPRARWQNDPDFAGS